MKKHLKSLKIKKKEGKKIACLTAYDYPTARLLDEIDLDILLVGDSLGMVVLGHPDTTQVTMADMIHHTKAVMRGVKKTWIVADLPINSYGTSEIALENSIALIAAGANAVKMEGGKECLPMIQTILQEGISVIGHLGMLPQRVKEEGGYRIKGKSQEEADYLIESAKALDQAGVSAIVLELVYPPLAKEISNKLEIPTIGIGSGPDCDGQILVFHDLVGLFPWFRPRFALPRANLAADIQRAAQEFVIAIRKK